MIWVYAIKSLKNGMIYVGMTADLDRRLAEHNAGKTKSNKAFAPFALIYKEGHPNYEEGRKREKYFKSGVGKESLKTL